MKKLNCNIEEFKFSEDKRLNSLYFKGRIGFVDKPSERSPHGAEIGWKSQLSKQGCEKAIKDLIGMGVNCTWGENWTDRKNNLSNHDPRFKIGVVDNAWIESNEIWAEGHLWNKDFADICNEIQEKKDELGFSVEITALDLDLIEDQKVYQINDLAFTGVAVLYKNRGAFLNTQFMMAALKEGTEVLGEKELKEALDAQEKAFNDKIEAVSGAVEKLTQSFAAIEEKLGKEEKPADTKPEDEGKEDTKEDVKEDVKEVISQSFAAMGDSLVAAIKEGFASTKTEEKEPARKTDLEFSALSKYGKDKTAMEFAEAINADKSLGSADKWILALKAWEVEKANKQ